MPRPRAAVPQALVAGPITVARAREAGVSAAELRRAALRAPTRGVRTTGPPPPPGDVAARCRDLLPALPAGAVFCHVTALLLLGVDLPLGLDPAGALHVQVGPGTSWPRRAGVRSHSRSTRAVPTRSLPGGLRVLAPELVWTQLAAVLAPRELVVLGDALSRRRRPLSTPDLLATTVASLPPGTRGVRRARAALPLVRARTDSPMETRLRWLLVHAGLPCPTVNQPVHGPDGELVVMPDMTDVGHRVAVEYDGDVHRTDRSTWRRDIARRQALEALGWQVITCTADDVLHHPTRAVTWVRRALSRAEAAPRLQQMQLPGR